MAVCSSPCRVDCGSAAGKAQDCASVVGSPGSRPVFARPSSLFVMLRFGHFYPVSHADPPFFMKRRSYLLVHRIFLRFRPRSRELKVVCNMKLISPVFFFFHSGIWSEEEQGRKLELTSTGMEAHLSSFPAGPFSPSISATFGSSVGNVTRGTSILVVLLFSFHEFRLMFSVPCVMN